MITMTCLIRLMPDAGASAGSRRRACGCACAATLTAMAPARARADAAATPRSLIQSLHISRINRRARDYSVETGTSGLDEQRSLAGGSRPFERPRREGQFRGVGPQNLGQLCG